MDSSTITPALAASLITTCTSISDIFSNDFDFTRCKLDLESEMDSSTNIHPYLVPIYTDGCKESNFNGNGVIIGDKLITASHVIKGALLIYFRFDSHLVEITADTKIFDGECKHEHGNSYDLAIFKLTDIDSPIRLEPSEPVINQHLSASPFNYNKKLNAVTCVSCQGAINCLTHTSINSCLQKQIFKNCFTISYIGGLNPGDSGCALYWNDTVYGILLSGVDMDTRSYKVLKSSFILDIIKNL